jgi:hypothetical protein
MFFLSFSLVQWPISQEEYRRIVRSGSSAELLDLERARDLEITSCYDRLMSELQGPKPDDDSKQRQILELRQLIHTSLDGTGAGMFHFIILYHHN